MVKKANIDKLNLKDKLLTSRELEDKHCMTGVSKTVVEKQEIINLLANGTSWMNTAKALGVGERVVRTVAGNHRDEITARTVKLKSIVDNLYDKETTGLASKIVVKGHMLLDSMDKVKTNKASLSQVALAFGIIVDKMRLLTDKSTHNVDMKFKSRSDVLGFLRSSTADKGVIDV